MFSEHQKETEHVKTRQTFRKRESFFQMVQKNQELCMRSTCWICSWIPAIHLQPLPIKIQIPTGHESPKTGQLCQFSSARDLKKLKLIAGITQHGLPKQVMFVYSLQFLELINKIVIRSEQCYFNGNWCTPSKKLLLGLSGRGIPINGKLAQRQKTKNRNIWSFFFHTYGCLYHTKTNLIC